MHNCKSGARDGFKCKLAVHNGNVFEIRAHRRIDNGTTCNTLPCPRWCILGLKQFQFLADLPLKIVDSANVNVMERLVGYFLPPVSAHSADCSPSPIDRKSTRLNSSH